ncbi:hypothetical protein AB0K40_17690 [Nonomuraea bangladeshensis]|uniref:Uncharacterized protein n=1 Tax=Nonomuraea bangladeshensis TaxID=404385 RepID=A0ABV3H483_9ACTN
MTMPQDGEHRPDLDEARQAAEQSRRRAEQDLYRARERAHRWIDLAARLRRLREANGFEAMFEEAFGGRG